jgi:N utilization substance protein A
VVYLYPEDATALVVVPDSQLSLAIGREGQNARLTARLTGWRVDIKSETQFNEEQTAFQSAYERGEVDEYGTPLTRAGEAALPDPDASVWEPTSEGVATAVGEPGASPASPESDSGR